jgi:hypothetical protein
MPRETLQLDTIGELDGGRAAGIINAAIKAAVADLDDRGGDTKARKVNISIEMKMDKNGHIFVSTQAKTQLPPYQTGGTLGAMRVTKNGPQLEFQPLAPDDPSQEPLPHMSGK